MYSKTLLAVFAIVSVTQSKAEAQLFRRFQKAPQQNCCQCQQQTQSTQAYTATGSYSPTESYSPTSYSPATTYPPATVLAPVEGLQSQFDDQSYTTNPIPIIDSQAYEIPLPEIAPQPEYGTLTPPSYLTVEGNSPLTSDMALPLVFAADVSTENPPTVFGQPTLETPSTFPTLASPQTITTDPTLGDQAPSIELSMPPATQAVLGKPAINGTDSSTMNSVIETQTIAPIKPHEPAPEAMRGQSETEEDERSILGIEGEI
jgi:hypothetical protein